MAQVSIQPFRGTRLIAISSGIGALGLVASLIGFSIAPDRAFHAWLAAFAFAVSISVGGLLFLMIGYACRARWPVVLHRLLEAIASGAAALALAFVPLLLGAGRLYSWVSPSPQLDEHARELLAHQAKYLNLPFFAARGALYFSIWIAVLLLLRGFAAQTRRAGRERDTDATEGSLDRAHARQRVVASVALPPVGLALTFAAFDWLMSLQPQWLSTAFGVYYFAGGFVASLGLLAALAYFSRRSSSTLEQAITPYHFHALGRLLFAFSIFWAYIAYFQAMLIQIADRPDEVVFYVDRLQQGWKTVAWLVAAGRFAVPFLLLLPRSIKFRPAIVAAAGGWIVLMHYLDLYWIVLPMAEGHGPLPGWLDLAALAGVGGLTAAFAALTVRGRPLIPQGDPLLAASIGYRSNL